MVAEDNRLPRHKLDLVLYGLPPEATIRLDLPSASSATIASDLALPAIQIGAPYMDPIELRSLLLQPRRLLLELASTPTLSLSLRIASAEPFLSGWLQVPGGVQASIATAVERIRVVGSGYWALPLPGPAPDKVGEGGRAPDSGIRAPLPARAVSAAAVRRRGKGAPAAPARREAVAAREAPD